MFLADYHVHSSCSFDAADRMAAMARAELKMGVVEICFTDHADFGDQQTIQLGPERFQLPKSQVKQFIEAMEKAPEGIDIKLGLELGEGNHDPARAKRVYAMPEYDFILGSLHNLRDEQDFYYIKYESYDQCWELYDRYLDELIELAGINCFDCMAHIGYCLRYMHRQGFDAEIPARALGVEGVGLEEAQGGLVRRDYAVVEAVYRDSALGVLHAREGLDKPPGGVRRDGGVHAVRVALGGLHLHMDVEHALDAHGDLAGAAALLLAALPDVAVALQELGMGLGEGLEVRGAYLLLALEKELDVAAQCVDDQKMLRRVYLQQGEPLSVTLGRNVITRKCNDFSQFSELHGSMMSGDFVFEPEVFAKWAADFSPAELAIICRDRFFDYYNPDMDIDKQRKLIKKHSVVKTTSKMLALWK